MLVWRYSTKFALSATSRFQSKYSCPNNLYPLKKKTISLCRAPLSECMKGMERNIAPHDIFFVVSEAQNDARECDHCFNTLKLEEGEEGFTFERYQSFQIPPPKPVDNLIHYPAVDAITCELKVLFINVAR